MFRKSYHEYLFSMQDENDPIAKYRKHREEMLMSVSPEKAKEQQEQLDKMAFKKKKKALKGFFPLVK